MLVGAFEVEIGGPGKRGPAVAFEHEDMRATRIEPHVEDVMHHLEIVGVVLAPKELGLARFVPRIDPALADGIDDALVHACVLQVGAVLADEQRDRHAPCALARKHPVGPAFDHRADTIAPAFGHEAHALDFGEGALTQRAGRSLCMANALALDDRRVDRMLRFDQGLVHRHEPLRRAAVDDLRLGAPRVRVGVLVVRARAQQRARFGEVRADRPVGRVEVGVDDRTAALVIPAKPRPVVAVHAAIVDREDRVDPVLAAQVEIVLAMVGRHVDEAGTGVGGDEVAREHGAERFVEPAKLVHRVADFGAGKFGAFETVSRFRNQTELCVRRPELGQIKLP